MALGMAIRVASGRIGAWAAAGAGLRTASRVACPAAPSIASGGAFSTATCDLTDAHMPDPVDRAEKSTSVRVVSPAMGFRDFGAVTAFHGQAVTISCFENNPLVREALMDEKGEGRVLVVDGGGSMRCANGCSGSHSPCPCVLWPLPTTSRAPRPASSSQRGIG